MDKNALEQLLVDVAICSEKIRGITKEIKSLVCDNGEYSSCNRDAADKMYSDDDYEDGQDADLSGCCDNCKRRRALWLERRSLNIQRGRAKAKLSAYGNSLYRLSKKTEQAQTWSEVKNV